MGQAMKIKELELYIHIPFCVKKCQYCDFLSFPAGEDVHNAYVDALLREIAYYGPRCFEYTVTTIYIGGGTPSWLREEAVEAVMKAVRRCFVVSPYAEISIECNPGTLTERKFAVYREAGINRLSIGMQSTDDVQLKHLGRIHTFDQFLRTYETARAWGFENINVDLMNALPHQTVEDCVRSVQQVINLGPEHISVYTLMIEKGTPFYDLYKFDAVKQHAGMKPVALPSEDDLYRMTKVTEQILKGAGYVHYEVSNFARRGYECRHNIGYWERDNYLGLGLGAASLMENIRYSNTRELYAYIGGTEKIKEVVIHNEVTEDRGEGEFTYLDAVWATNLHVSAERITRKAQIEEFMFLGLRMIEGISREKFEQAFGVPIEAVYYEVLEKLKEEELLVKRAGRVYLSEKGQDLSNYALAQFLL